MKVNFNVAFKNFDGSDITEPYEVVEKKIVDGKEMEVTKTDYRPKMISVMVASVLFIGKECKTVEEKMTAFNLSQRIYKAKGAIEISPEDAVLIKRLTAESLIAGAYALVANVVEDNIKK